MDGDELREDRHSQLSHLHPQFLCLESIWNMKLSNRPLPGYTLPIIVQSKGAAIAATFGVLGTAYGTLIA